MSYEENLVELGSLSLKDKRTYLDQVERYRIVYNISCSDPTFILNLLVAEVGSQGLPITKEYSCQKV